MSAGQQAVPANNANNASNEGAQKKHMSKAAVAIIAVVAYRNFCGAYNRGPALWEQACRPVIFVAWKMMRPPVVGWMA